MREIEEFMDNKPNLPTETDVLTYLANPENSTDARHGRMCGDGRYKETRGRLSRFGGDGGYVLGLLAINRIHKFGLTPEEIVNSTVEASIKDGEKFSIHTDENEGNEPYSIGCGHLARASLQENEEKYGVNYEDVRSAIIHIKQLAKTDPDKVEIEKLEGKHNERWVVLDESKKKKVAHMHGPIQGFTVSVKRDQDYVVKVLYPRLIAELPELGDVNVEEFLNVLDNQTKTTSGELAKGLPAFKGNLDGPEPEVNYIGVIS